MRPVPRSLYLAHYAKDENGRCVGTGEPAEDCVLGDEDMIKHRAKKTCSASNSGNEVDRSDRGTGQPGGQQNENAGLRTRISDAEHQSFATKRKRGGLCRRLKGGDSDDGFVR